MTTTAIRQFCPNRMHTWRFHHIEQIAIARGVVGGWRVWWRCRDCQTFDTAVDHPPATPLGRILVRPS